MTSTIEIKCHLCSSPKNTFLLKIDKKPVGETAYGISEEKYYREIHQCNNCGVFFNARDKNLIPKDFYEGKYNEAIKFGSLERRFSKIITFPFSKSDNKQRVLRIVDFLYQNDYPISGMHALDVGAGTCVFLHEMKKFGFNTYSVDPDPVSAKHSKETVKVDEAYRGTLDSVPLDTKFDLISFNKVLEHIINPIPILAKAKQLLSTNGLIYLELPDGTEIAEENNFIDRSEFYIDHHTIFNKKSFSYLYQDAGLFCKEIKRITDPSGKKTIFGFLTKK